MFNSGYAAQIQSIMASKKTILIIEATDRTYTVRYSGSFKYSPDKAVRKHNERLINMLIDNDDLFEFLYNIVEPVVRYRRREAKRKAKEQAASNQPLTEA